MDVGICDRFGLMQSLHTTYVTRAITAIPPKTPPTMAPTFGLLLLLLADDSESFSQIDVAHIVQSRGTVNWQTSPSEQFGHSSWAASSHFTQLLLRGTSW